MLIGVERSDHEKALELSLMKLGNRSFNFEVAYIPIDNVRHVEAHSGLHHVGHFHTVTWGFSP